MTVTQAKLNLRIQWAVFAANCYSVYRLAALRPVNIYVQRDSHRRIIQVYVGHGSYFSKLGIRVDCVFYDATGRLRKGHVFRAPLSKDYYR